MDRRDMILSTAAMAVSASLGAIACGAANATAQGVATIPRDAAAALTDLALDCQKKGAACLEHCDRLIAAGDTSMVECEANVRDMLAVTEMLAKLAKPGSMHLAAAARITADICQDCEASCRRHAEQHAVCRDCADSCAKIVARVRQLTA